MIHEPKTVEVAIIGAGPLGIELAIALKREGISYLLFDKGQACQMIYNFPTQTHFFSSSDRIGIAGIPIQTIDQQKCSREDYLTYMRMVITHFQLEINAYEEIIDIKIKPHNKGFTITSQTIQGKKQYNSHNIVIATGGTSYPRLLGIKGESLPHVSIKMEDPHCYFQQKILVIGSRNSSAETALRCFHAGAKVSLVFRREALDVQHIKYWILPELKSRIENGEIESYPGVNVEEILPGRVIARKVRDKQIFEIPCEFVIKTLGFEADMSLFTKLGIGLLPPQNNPIYDESTMETPVKGVFVLGTVVGGTQIKYRVFIDNCHIHVTKIMQTICQRLGKKCQPFEGTQPVENRSLEE